MSPLVQVVIAAVTAGLPTLTVLVSLLINNQRLTDLSRQIDQRSTELASAWISALPSIGKCFGPSSIVSNRSWTPASGISKSTSRVNLVWWTSKKLCSGKSAKPFIASA